MRKDIRRDIPRGEKGVPSFGYGVIAIRKELRQGCLPNIPGHARGIEELGEDIANLAYKLQGWIAMDGGPVDPLCQAYDAAAPSIRGGIGGPPDDELQA